MQLYIQSNPANYTLASPYVVFCDLSIILLPRPFSVTSLAPCGCYTYEEIIAIYLQISHYKDFTMSVIVSQITSNSTVYSTICSLTSKKISKLTLSTLCEGNSLVTGGFPLTKATNAESVSGYHNSGRSCGHQSNHTDGLVSVASPLLAHLRYCSHALRHRYVDQCQ